MKRRFFTGKSRSSEDEAEDSYVLLDSVRPLAQSRKRGSVGAAVPSFPRFRTTAADRLDDSAQHGELADARLAVNEVFTPTQPVTDRSRFAGRLGVLARLISILEDQRSHVVIYGERGIGKTSLVHILADVARESRYLVVYASCGANSRFDSIFRGVLSEVPQLYLRNVSPTDKQAESGATVADLLPEGDFDARLLGDICADITGTRVIVILDEYDRVGASEFRQSVAELIKNLSDRAARVQLVVTGVASNLQELIGYIPSIRRNVVGLPMPKLTPDEVQKLIAIGEAAGGVRFQPGAVDMIDLLCNGSPYLARLISHHAGIHALDDSRMEVDLSDILAALNRIVDEAEARLAPIARARAQHLFSANDLATLGAIARSAGTPDGWFTVESVATYLPGKVSKNNITTEIERIVSLGDLMERSDGTQGPIYRFVDEALPVYVWMTIARDHFATGGAAGDGQFIRAA